ncbi:hypothetical protein AB4571_02330 [Vibrio breoganii]|uniref:hypothetical protein n=1 Tax=Vibrio breoganii TaxID=553239 RepID=UPI000C844A22|nr:hypothetical protein [Vibrio breoganii]PML12750.1 hypothetical protein BCT84_02375 [Vibrio breoganii]
MNEYQARLSRTQLVGELIDQLDVADVETLRKVAQNVFGYQFEVEVKDDVPSFVTKRKPDKYYASGVGRVGPLGKYIQLKEPRNQKALRIARKLVKSDLSRASFDTKLRLALIAEGCALSQQEFLVLAAETYAEG